MRATHLPLLLGGLGLALGAAALIAARRRPAGLLVGAWRLDDGQLVIPALQLAPKPATRWGSGKEEAARKSERPIDYSVLKDDVGQRLDGIVAAEKTVLDRYGEALEKQSRQILQQEIQRLLASVLSDQRIEHAGENVVR
jgi:hypothetical protein